jgi:lipopolysaccharide/colanic/teichoic acid biosynthesis glycosyltransferase
MTVTTTDIAFARPSLTSLSAKRALDLGVTLAVLLLLWPVLLILALAVAMTSRGPVFFCQTRVGLNGVPFRMIKFRSMYADAEARRAALVAQSDREGICLKLRHDPRVTPVGRFIRRWSLDELPQLFNVLTGEMSLVGPRPALPEEVAAYPEHAHLRHRVKPGLTGVWQVSGRADVSFDDMIDMDIAYARTAGIRRDLAILFLTIPAVLSGRGAY